MSSNPYIGLGIISDYAGMSYYFEVVGPADIEVPIDVSYELSTSYIALFNPIYIFPDDPYEPYPDLSADIQIVTAMTNTIGQTYYFVQSDVDESSESTLETTTVANDLNEISIQANVTNEDYGKETAMVDPYITINPAFLPANPGYSVIVSAGVSNSPIASIPEPSTWTMILAGFAALGFAGYRGARRGPSRSRPPDSRLWPAAASARPRA